MNLDVNHIDFNNNYQISIDLDKAIYSYCICLKGKYYRKIFPKGTILKQVLKEVKKIFKPKKIGLEVKTR
jgi:hypothetical protein|tara:strand:+ start:330 stop:539 length:210 start_codon:yes stop_codon:yes gene_type:complete